MVLYRPKVLFIEGRRMGDPTEMEAYCIGKESYIAELETERDTLRHEVAESVSCKPKEISMQGVDQLNFERRQVLTHIARSANLAKLNCVNALEFGYASDFRAIEKKATTELQVFAKKNL